MQHLPIEYTRRIQDILIVSKTGETDIPKTLYIPVACWLINKGGPMSQTKS